jgi:hypothetical protein
MRPDAQVRYRLEASGGENALVYVDAVLSLASVAIYVMTTYR